MYETLPGWHCDLTSVRAEADFPKAYADYIAYLEKKLATRIAILSVGPERDATIIR